MIEDQALVRASLTALINTTDDYQVVVAVASVAEAIAALEQHQAIDLILSDFHLRHETAHRLLQSKQSLPPVILLSSLFNAIEIQSCMSLAARGFLFKECELEEMLKAFADVLAGGVYFALQTLPAQRQSNSAEQTAILDLTPSEKEILRWLATGMSNKEIALALGKSAETVKVQLAGVMRKLNVRTRTQAVVKAGSLHLL